MCTFSMIGDHYGEIWKDRWPRPQEPQPVYPQPHGGGVPPIFVVQQPEVTRAEFDELKRQVDEMVMLLKRAKKYDEDNGEPDCEVDEKIAILRKVADLVGVDLDKELGKR